MTALEQEIVDKFRLLDEAAQRRILAQIEQDVRGETLEPMTTEEWLKWAIAFGERIEKKYGPDRISSVELLHEAQEERLNDIMGGR